MYYDPIRNAYIDMEDGSVVLQEDSYNNTSVDTSNKSNNNNNNNNNYHSINKNINNNPVDNNDLDINMMIDPAIIESQKLELERIERQRSNKKIEHGNEVFTDYNPIVADPPVGEHNNNNNNNNNSDWLFARALQAMEFEISNEEIRNEHGDFDAKEYSASRSCLKQMLTLSTLICILQIGVLIAMVQVGGWAPRSENPMIGPPAWTLVRFGAKESALIVDDNQWWRLFSSIMLHAGLLHLIPNVLIQLRVGGYLNLVYGTPKWFAIYLLSGVFGEMMSCIFITDSVGVGSSGALMGMLSSWVIWIVFRWKKIPPECHRQRNCQIGIVIASIIITLATSFSPNVDWGAHFGGAIQGILWGCILLGNELDNVRNKRVIQGISLSISITLFVYSFYYMAVKLNPSTTNLSYWNQNDWNH